MLNFEKKGNCVEGCRSRHIRRKSCRGALFGGEIKKLKFAERIKKKGETPTSTFRIASINLLTHMKQTSLHIVMSSNRHAYLFCMQLPS